MKFNGTYFLVIMDRGGPYLNTGSKYRGIKRFVLKIQGGGRNKNPFGGRVNKKYLRRTRVKQYYN